MHATLLDATEPLSEQRRRALLAPSEDTRDDDDADSASVLAGVSLWGVIADADAAPARAAALVNRNSETWGGGGALVADLANDDDDDDDDGDDGGGGGGGDDDDSRRRRRRLLQQRTRFKLVVENSVGDAVLYRAGRALLAANDCTSASLPVSIEPFYVWCARVGWRPSVRVLECTIESVLC